MPLRACLLLLAGLAAATCTAPDRATRPGDDRVVATPEPDPMRIGVADGRAWRRLAADALHDPRNDLLPYLQEPAEALATLPKGGPDGNQVDWMAALRDGHIAPRTNVRPETRVRVLDLDIAFPDTAGQPQVVFPHRQHTEWLDCANCHPAIFVARRGANDFGMFDVLQGEYCGRCHGAVAFPLTECRRCHSGDPAGGGS